MSKKKSQKIIVPKGTIDPNEDTVIEIPKTYKEVSVVVATKSDKNVSASRSTKSITGGCAAAPCLPEVVEYNYPKYNQKATNQLQPLSYIQSRTPDQSSQYKTAIQCTNFLSTTSEQNLKGISLTDLNATEEEEKKQVHKKLEAFQKARRQFLLEANTITTTNKGVQTRPLAGIPSSTMYASQVQTGAWNGTYIRSSRSKTRRVQVSSNDSDDDIDCICK